MARGIAPSLLAAQVASTAAWAHPQAPVPPAASTPAADSWRRALDDARDPAGELEARFADEGDLAARLRYLRVLLAAHFATVATIVPTDVDSHIRFHFWWSLPDTDALRAAVAVVEETDAWDPREVSARVRVSADGSVLSGHDGEWLAVRAGALGRALALGDEATARALEERIDAELLREERFYVEARGVSGGEHGLLCVATLLAHNVGDLSRVVEAWPRTVPDAAARRARFARLGHDAASVLGEAGHVNKALMADENHRYLPLRAARPLRRGRELVIPFGPYFDPWGRIVARSTLLDDRDRAEILAVLLDAHEAAPPRLAYGRALAGLHESARGGLERLARDHLPARARKQLSLPSVREALRTPEEAHEARFAKRLRTLLGK